MCLESFSSCRTTKQRIIEKVSTKNHKQQQQQEKSQKPKHQQQWVDRNDKRKRDQEEPQQLAVYNDDLPWMRGGRNKEKGGRGKNSKNNKGGCSSGSGHKDAPHITSVKKEQYKQK